MTVSDAARWRPPQRVRPVAIVVVRHGERLLVMEGHDQVRARPFYRPLGGTIEFGERGEDAVRRELREEIGAELRNVRQLGMIENLYELHGARGHEIVLVYEADLAEPALYALEAEVGELEERLAAWTGARHCVTVASGTEALLIALMALGVKPGDEVVTTPFTFVATAEMIVLLGAKPVFVDAEEATANIDVSKLEAAITPRTRAIMPVWLYGQPADMDEINAIAARRGLPVIEDAAQSFGATYKGRKSCNLSAIGCTSFFPSKPLGCYGDGGAIFTGDDALAAAMREIRVHGQSGRYNHTRIGVGGRMDSIQCAVVLAKLERFEWEVANARRSAGATTPCLRRLARA